MRRTQKATLGGSIGFFGAYLFLRGSRFDDVQTAAVVAAVAPAGGTQSDCSADPQLATLTTLSQLAVIGGGDGDGGGGDGDGGGGDGGNGGGEGIRSHKYGGGVGGWMGGGGAGHNGRSSDVCPANRKLRPSAQHP